MSTRSSSGSPCFDAGLTSMDEVGPGDSHTVVRVDFLVGPPSYTPVSGVGTATCGAEIVTRPPPPFVAIGDGNSPKRSTGGPCLRRSAGGSSRGPVGLCEPLNFLAVSEADVASLSSCTWPKETALSARKASFGSVEAEPTGAIFEVARRSIGWGSEGDRASGAGSDKRHASRRLWRRGGRPRRFFAGGSNGTDASERVEGYIESGRFMGTGASPMELGVGE